MPREWTKAQNAAINTRNKTLLVSAAAGSGKTAALTERIIRSVTDKENPKDVSKMLIVTFTRAAAAELRQRIFKALTEALADEPDNRYLSEQLIALSSAKICTIDAFYLDVVRQGFDKLGLSPSFRTADASELSVLARSIMEDTIDFFYEKDSKKYSHIAECFVSARNASTLADIFLDLYDNVESLPEGIELLKISAHRAEKSIGKDFFKNPWGEVLLESILDEARYIASVFKECTEICIEDEILSEKYLPSFAYDLGFTEKLVELLESSSYDACRAHISTYSPIKLAGIKGKTEEAERVSSTRKDLVDKIRKMSKRDFFLSPESIESSMKRTAEVTRGIYDLLVEFESRFDAEKKQRNVASFGDVRRYAMKLLIDENGEPTDTAKAYAEYFTDIYIDEYQDVDRVQDMIFRAIAKADARFMVGDIKQSIYRFRGAEPDVFASYRKEFPSIDSPEADHSESASVFMSNNFRCDENIIKFTNNVCSYIFSSCVDSMGYTKDDDLVFTKRQEDKINPEVPVEVSILIPPDDKENDVDDKLAAEAKFVASQIKELLTCGRLNNNDPIKPEDIAVLYRSGKIAPYIQSALTELGIETTETTGGKYFKNPDVLLMLCLLNAIDNPQRDVYLAGLLRSPLFDFSMDELIAIRSSADSSASLYDALCEYNVDEALAKKCHNFEKTLENFRDRAVALSVDKLIEYLYSTELFAANGLINNNEGNNLLRLYEYARKYENGSFKGLYSFISYINRLIDEDKQFESETVSVAEGRVTLMNIHKSKGLEFPVCFIFGTGKLFNKDDVKDSLVYDSSLGIAMKIADNTGFARTNTPMREALIKRINFKNTEEEMRILYVALTRARERLFVSASISGTEEKILSKSADAHRFSCDYTIRTATSYIDWILNSIDQNVENDFLKLSFIKRNEIDVAIDGFGAELEKANKLDKDEVKKIKAELKDKFAFTYPYGEATKLPAKVSVSKLLPITEKEDGITELFSDIESDYPVPAILRGKTDENTITAAMRGTATHLFLQFCDFSLAEKNGVVSELSRLIDKGFIPSDSRELVFIEELSKFFESELYSSIKTANKIIREQRFNILLPPCVLSQDEKFLRETSGEELAVQGVIDILFEDASGELILCDYKTDRLTKDELENDALLKKKMTERHAKQIEYYKKAIEQLFSKRCKKALIYSTHAAKTVEI